MANVFLIGLEQTLAAQVTGAIAQERHRIHRKPHDVAVRDLMEAQIIFAGGDAVQYLSLLRRVRKERPALPFVVVTAGAQMTAWLDALEAGATDYCCSPFERRQIHWLMESALPLRKAAAGG